MTDHVLKSIQERYGAMASGGRIDLRALGDNTIFPGDRITFQEVNTETRVLTGREHTRDVVKVSEWFPCAYNSAEEVVRANLLGFKQQKVYPIAREAAAAVLGAGGMTFAVMSAPERHIDLRPTRPELAMLKEGDVVAYEFQNRADGKTHLVGRIVKHNDLYDFELLYGDKAVSVLESGLLVVGLSKLEEAVE